MQENGRREAIRIACESAALIDYKTLTELQGHFKRRSKEDVDRMSRSILKYGFSFPFFVWRDGATSYCMDGHGRLTALRALEKAGHEIPLVPVAWVDAEDIQEAKQKLLRMNSTYGEITIEGVREFTADMDVDWDEVILPQGTLELDEDVDPDDQYSRKIQPPIYEPTMDEPPGFEAMVDTSKRDRLEDDITVAKTNGLLTVDEERLLREAAQRHIVFNYAQVAEYYAHANPVVQDLMERSALVIIDFDKAIEHGFVKLTKRMAEAYATQVEAEDGA